MEEACVGAFGTKVIHFRCNLRAPVIPFNMAAPLVSTQMQLISGRHLDLDMIAMERRGRGGGTGD